MNSVKEERHHLILGMLEKEKKVLVAKLAESFHVTPETIRRDLTELEEQEQLTRIHGGAVVFTRLEKEQAFQNKLNMFRAEKIRIAAEAAARIGHGDTIAVDVGSTTVHIADAIHDLQNVTVVTNSLCVAERFNAAIEEKRMTGKVIMLGGVTNPAQASVSGAMTLEWLGHLHFDKAFISCGGLVRGTIYDYDMDESLVSAKMIALSSEVLLLADSSKIGRPSFFSICQSKNIHEIISDQPCPDELEKWYENWCVAGKDQ